MGLHSFTDSLTFLLLGAAAKGTVLLLCAWLMVWLCRRSSAALRHSIWRTSMAGLLLLPFATWALPGRVLPILPSMFSADSVTVLNGAAVPEQTTLIDTSAADAGVQSRAESGHPATSHHLSPPQTPVAVSPERREASSTTVRASTGPAAPPFSGRQWAALLIVGVWSLGAAAFGAVLLVGLRRTAELRRSSLAVTEGVSRELLGELQKGIGLAQFVELREHAESAVPLTWGVLRPVVMLPRTARDWDESTLRAVLLHELSHVRRGDVASQLLGRLACVLY